MMLDRHAAYRFVSANEGDGLVMRSGPGFDLSSGYSLVPQTPSVGVQRSGQPRGGEPITIAFYAQAYRP